MQKERRHFQGFRGFFFLFCFMPNQEYGQHKSKFKSIPFLSYVSFIDFTLFDWLCFLIVCMHQIIYYVDLIAILFLIY